MVIALSMLLGSVLTALMVLFVGQNQLTHSGIPLRLVYVIGLVVVVMLSSGIALASGVS